MSKREELSRAAGRAQHIVRCVADVQRSRRRGARPLAGAIAAALLASAPGLRAQSNVEGYVYGAGQAGTEVRLENVDTGYTRTATVQSTGTFRSPNVPPGTYKVTYTGASGELVTREVAVTIGAGASVDLAADIEEVVVTGSSIKRVDMTKTESVTTLTAETLDRLPVARDVQQVALLAPGVVQGDAGFTSQSGQPLVSFGGASPGENAYFINGFNVTDFRNFLGGATIPFEFYDQFELRTGGYSAEFGRSLGGVINAVSKRGTNNFEYGVTAYWQPEGLTEKRPNTTYVDPQTGARQLRIDNSQDYNSEMQVNVEAGGPIIQDRLFLYGLGVLRSVRDDDAAGTSSLTRKEDDSPFFGGKLDWQIADNHAAEYTYLRDRSEVDVDNYDYTASSRSLGARKSVGAREQGGDTHILRYSGTIIDDLTLSALYGRSERTDKIENVDAVTGGPCTLVTDIRGGQNNPLNCWDASGDGQVLDTTDERDAYRLDLTWFLGAHSVKLGYDFEKNVSDTRVEYEGGVGYRYSDATPGQLLNGGAVPDGVFEVARQRFYNVQGEFEEKLSAWYIEDSWQATDRLLLSLGLRNETLENYNRDGQEFLGFDAQLTPRLGFSFDLLGDARTKLFGNAGRYTMPIATNTNIRFAGGEFFTEQYYVLEGVNADGLPVLGAPIGRLRTLADGSVPSPAGSVDRDIKPMYQDEFILGLQSEVRSGTTLGLKVTYRDLVRAVEDSAFVDADNNFYYFLFNPGSDVTLQNEDGSYTTISAAELGFPEAKRTHWAAELTFDHQIGAAVRLGGSYTWSHTYGNFEGVFQSDVQQDDAGITVAFDTPGLALYADGDLPADRRHNLKVYGTWSPAPDWLLSFNASAVSGRPKNARGNCPTDVDPSAYEQYCFYAFDEPSPRGSAGRLPWLYNIDLGLRYTPALLQGLTVGVDVFNVFNFDKPTRIQEAIQQPGDETAPPDPSYGSATYYQAPRYMRFTASYNF